MHATMLVWPFTLFRNPNMATVTSCENGVKSLASWTVNSSSACSTVWFSL